MDSTESPWHQASAHVCYGQYKWMLHNVFRSHSLISRCCCFQKWHQSSPYGSTRGLRHCKTNLQPRQEVRANVIMCLESFYTNLVKSPTQNKTKSVSVKADCKFHKLKFTMLHRYRLKRDLLVWNYYTNMQCRTESTYSIMQFQSQHLFLTRSKHTVSVDMTFLWAGGHPEIIWWSRGRAEHECDRWRSWDTSRAAPSSSHNCKKWTEIQTLQRSILMKFLLFT